MILMKDALALMEARDASDKLVTFDCEFCTYSTKRSEGGKIVKLTGARLSFDKKPFKGKASVIKSERTFSAHQPNHFVNKTRNLRLPNGEIRKLHIRMLLTFNGKQVVY